MFTQHFLSCCMMSLLIWLNIFGATYLLNIFPVIPDFPGTPDTVNLLTVCETPSPWNNVRETVL